MENDAEGIGGLLAVVVASNGTSKVYLPLTDGLGNIAGLIDSSDGSLAAEYDYDPYGNIVIQSGVAANACPFRHRTRYYDGETWLYYYGYRYYDPSTCKWISKDPLGEAGGWNLTAFCGCDPINNYDALGLSWLSACFGFGFEGPEADAFDAELSDDYWSGRMGRRAGAAAAAELEVLAGVGEGMAGAKVAAGSAGALGAVGYALAADASSRIAGGAGHYLNLFDGGDRQWDAVGDAAYAAGGRYGRYTSLARDLAGAAGMAASLNRLANLASSALDAEAQAALRESQAASRLDSLPPAGVRSAPSPTGVGAAKKTLLPAEITTGMEINPVEINIFRGGSSLEVRSIDVKLQNGLVQSARGVSVQIGPEGLARFGGAYSIESLPAELKLVQRGQRLGHFEIVPRDPMPLERFQELLKQVRMKPYGE